MVSVLTDCTPTVTGHYWGFTARCGHHPIRPRFWHHVPKVMVFENIFIQVVKIVNNICSKVTRNTVAFMEFIESRGGGHYFAARPGLDAGPCLSNRLKAESFELWTAKQRQECLWHEQWCDLRAKMNIFSVHLQESRALFPLCRQY